MASVLDHRSRQTAVRNQGDRPTCAAFAVTAAHEWMTKDQPDLSAEFALWAAKAIDGLPGEATSVAAAFEGISLEAHALESDWPYGKPAFPAGPPTSAADRSRRRQPGPWRRLPALTPSAVRGSLEAGDAVVLTVDFVAGAWFAARVDGWVDAPPGATVIDGHAVLAVGIRPQANGRPESILIKNSWGPKWGENGYGYLTSTYLTRYGRRAYALAVLP